MRVIHREDRYPQVAAVGARSRMRTTILTGMTKAWRYPELRARGLSDGQIQRHVENQRLWRPYNGVFLPNHERGELTRLLALFRRLPPEAALCRHSAARLHGFGGFVAKTSDIRVVLPAGVPRPSFRGIRVHESALPVERILVHGLPCVPVTRCAIELARTSSRPDALAALDGALRSGACSPTDLGGELLLHAGLPGVCQARGLLPRADPRAQCRQESHLRLIIADGGLPRPDVQVAVQDGNGRVRYILDLGWRERRVGAEYDGCSHLDRERARHDRERHNWLAARGWRMRYFTDLDLYRRPWHILAVLREALALP